MKREIRLYNIILPLWLILWLPSWLWLAVIPGNLLVDCLAVFLALLALKVTEKKAVLKRVWWRIWLQGFAADFVGALWLLLGMWGPAWVYFGLLGHDQVTEGYPAWLNTWDNLVGHISHNPFANPAAFLWTLAGVAISGVCIYFWDRRALRRCPELGEREGHIAALVMAVFTAPWLYFIPVY